MRKESSYSRNFGPPCTAGGASSPKSPYAANSELKTHKIFSKKKNNRTKYILNEKNLLINKKNT